MTIQRMIKLLEIEHECMLRGSHDNCDRLCEDCELVQDDHELHEMYTNVISLLKEQQVRKSKDEVLTAIISSQGYTDIETFKRTVLEIDNFEDDFLGGLFMAVKAVEKLFEAH